jgi:uncharacterized OB-fold protein
MYCVYLGKAVQTVNPPNASVGTSQLINDAVTKDKVSNLMYPAFEAYDESSQSVSDNTYTKLDVATENFDTNNNFDNSAMRFTPTVAGKYFVYAKSDCDATGYEDLRDAHVAFYKNGSILTYTNARFMQGNTNSDGGTIATPFTSAVITLNGSSDYVEVYVKINSQDGSNGNALNSIFGGYRIGD